MNSAPERLREDQIRPDQLRAEQMSRFHADIRRLLSRRSEFVEVGCPGCERRDGKFAFTKYELSYLECPGCRTLYINPRPSPAVLEMYYSQSENYAYWNNVIFPASQEARRERIFMPRVKRVLELTDRFAVKRGTLLEVGAGFGIFCEEMGRTGRFQRVIGVEPTPDLAATCRQRGIETIELPIEKVDLGGTPIDVVASFEVIEHLFRPRDFIASCARVLAPGGLLVMTCPNGRGFDVTVMGAASDTVDVEHLNYFNPTSLSALVTTCGFEVLEVSTPGQLDAELVRKKVLAGEFSLEGQPFLRQVLLERWEEAGGPFQDFLASNALSSHMWVVARLDKAASPANRG
jgi:2-polyprenyl-3-methyl-5-hydroxy-6-metoxy-1,4-benzoquinol methylase